MRNPGKFVVGLLVAFLLLAAGASSARADEFNFVYIGTSGDLPANISGTLTTTALSGGQATITGISGIFNGSPITALLAPGSFALNDNLLFFPGPPTLDVFGVSFAVGTTDVNIFHNPLEYDEFTVSPGPIVTMSSGTFTVTPTPEPTSLALLGTGLLGLPLLRRIRRKSD